MQTLAGLSPEACNQAAAEEVRKYCQGPVHELSFIQHGADNLIVLADQALVFRFPRNSAAERRLHFEAALLEKLEGRIDFVAIPQIIHIHQEPLYAVARYIPGDHLMAPAIKALAVDEQQLVGATIARFMVALNDAISGSEVQQLRTQAGLDAISEPWASYFARLFSVQQLPDQRLQPLVDEWYPRWKTYVAQQDRIHAIHDDLHPVNLLFVGSKLTGILDFGDTNIGGVEEEMRWLYAMGDAVLTAAIDEYTHLTGITPNYQHIRTWAVMHELSSFTDGLARNQTDAYPFQRARTNLAAWLPDFPL